MNELEYIQSVHRAERRRSEFVFDVFFGAVFVLAALAYSLCAA
jgi:hypothetical protein